MRERIATVQSGILLAAVFLYPLWFTPIFFEPLATAKFYFLSFSVLILTILSLVSMLVDKKLTLLKSGLVNAVVVFLSLFLAAVIVSTPNKIEIVANPYFGFITLMSLGVVFYMLSYKNLGVWALRMLSYSAMTACVIAILVALDILKYIPFVSPDSLLASPTFSPVGSPVDLLIFLGFFLLVEVIKIYRNWKKTNHLLFALLLSVAMIISLYNINRRSVTITTSSRFFTHVVSAPLDISAQAVVKLITSPQAFLFGAGIDNIHTPINKAKTLEFNKTRYWSAQFDQAGSTLLHLFLISGIVGFLGFGLIIVMLLVTTARLFMNRQHSELFIYTLYLLVVLALFPPSQSFLLILFVILAIAARVSTSYGETHRFTDISTMADTTDLNLSPTPVAVTFFIPLLMTVLALMYLASRGFLAEYYFKQSLNAYFANNATQTYTLQKKALEFNPYNDREHVSFSKINLIIANSLITATTSGELSLKNRQTATQAVQQAIAEGKNAVALNDQKALNWENLADIYRTIIPLAQGAESWAISSYQQAIALDPQNPRIRIGIGGVYYLLGRLDDAQNAFSKAILLKPDYANAYYNLAWTYNKQGKYDKAIETMEKVLARLPAGSESYNQVQRDLQTFQQNRSPKSQNQPQVDVPESNFGIPEVPEVPISPKLELPKEASPESTLR